MYTDTIAVSDLTNKINFIIIIGNQVLIKPIVIVTAQHQPIIVIRKCPLAWGTAWSATSFLLLINERRCFAIGIVI